MNFDLEEKLRPYIVAGNLNDAIKLVESHLSSYQDTPFPQIIGRDILLLTEDLLNYLDRFIGTLERKMNLQSLYGEMNGFYLNYDLWFVDCFGYDFIGTSDDRDWLADFEDEHASTQRFIIKGFEDIQLLYKDHFEQGSGKIERQENAAKICDYAMILRLQELFRATFKLAAEQNKSWATLPIFVTAHDYELIYRIN